MCCEKQPYGTRFARDILTSLRSVVGAVFLVTAIEDSKRKSDYGTRFARDIFKSKSDITSLVDTRLLIPVNFIKFFVKFLVSELT